MKVKFYTFAATTCCACGQPATHALVASAEEADDDTVLSEAFSGDALQMVSISYGAVVSKIANWLRGEDHREPAQALERGFLNPTTERELVLIAGSCAECMVRLVHMSEVDDCTPSSTN